MSIVKTGMARHGNTTLHLALWGYRAKLYFKTTAASCPLVFSSEQDYFD